MRKVIGLNKDWLFVKGVPCSPDKMPEVLSPGCEKVDLPHTWNSVDGHDGHIIDIPVKDWSQGDLSGAPVEFYERTAAWYYREFDAPRQPLPGGRTYVEIPAASMVCDVFVNGKAAAHHENPFSLFRADVTDLLAQAGPNLLAICVSNEYNDHVYPQHADFTFYGGLYRGVNLVSTAAAHFDLDYCGSCGVKVTPRLCEDGTALIAVKSFLKGTDENHIVQYSLTDRDGNECALAARPSSSPDAELFLAGPHLWSPSDPYLYTLTARIVRRNEVVDEVTVKTGIRSFFCDPQKGFILNGSPLPLRGVCRHQDRLYKGNALTAEDHREDALIIKELGANTIRLAHYQHDQAFYDACDELGFVVWAEIPFITIMRDDPAAHANCRLQMKELIIQNYNHPSICFWGLSNEVLLGGKLSDLLIENHKDLEALVKSLDPTRLSTIAHVSGTPGECGLHGITDVEAYNHYFGWYVGAIDDNAAWLDDYHSRYPDRCLGLSEYGCEGIITTHTDTPSPKDYSEEYQALYHETLARVIHERPWIWGTYVWNMFDFGAAARNEGGVAGRNNKGLVTMDRKIKKDSWYIYKAWWDSTPMVHICGKRHFKRTGPETQIKVYSNQPSVTLSVNGSVVGTKTAAESEDKVFVFTVPLREGVNHIAAEAGEVRDWAMVEK